MTEVAREPAKMFQRILVPVDFTRKNLRGIGVASRIAGQRKGRVTLLHVIERIDAGDPKAFQTFYRRLENNAEKRMKALTGELQKRGVSARAEIRFGNRVSEILRFAEESRIDLIVMSSHKLRMRVPGENWGTISYKVGILSRCPVLLVK